MDNKELSGKWQFPEISEWPQNPNWTKLFYDMFKSIRENKVFPYKEKFQFLRKLLEIISLATKPLCVGNWYFSMKPNRSYMCIVTLVSDPEFFDNPNYQRGAWGGLIDP